MTHRNRLFVGAGFDAAAAGGASCAPGASTPAGGWGFCAAASGELIAIDVNTTASGRNNATSSRFILNIRSPFQSWSISHDRPSPRRRMTPKLAAHNLKSEKPQQQSSPSRSLATINTLNAFWPDDDSASSATIFALSPGFSGLLGQPSP